MVAADTRLLDRVVDLGSSLAPSAKARFMRETGALALVGATRKLHVHSQDSVRRQSIAPAFVFEPNENLGRDLEGLRSSRRFSTCALVLPVVGFSNGFAHAFCGKVTHQRLSRSCQLPSSMSLSQAGGGCRGDQVATGEGGVDSGRVDERVRRRPANVTRR